MEDVDPEIEAVLVRGLAGLAPAAWGSRAGYSAVAWTARRLRTETATRLVEQVPGGAERAHAVVAGLLHATPTFDEESGQAVYRGEIGSGIGGLNPAYVLATIEDGTGTVALSAYGKEGLITQRTAARAVERIARRLLQD